jgi:hypothetical protein
MADLAGLPLSVETHPGAWAGGGQTRLLLRWDGEPLTAEPVHPWSVTIPPSLPAPPPNRWAADYWAHWDGDGAPQVGAS